MEFDNLESVVKDLNAKGIPLLNNDPESRAKGFPVSIHPKAARGMAVELMEKEKS